MKETLPGRYLRRAKETIHYEGPHFLLWRVLVKGLSPWGTLGLMTLLRKDLTRPLKKIPTRSDLTVCQATEADIKKLATLIHIQHRAGTAPASSLDQGLQQRLSDLFQKGHRCFLGRIGGEIVHYNWIYFCWNESVTHTGRFVVLKDDEALLNDAYTLGRWRGKAIHTIVQYHMLRFLKEAGFRMAYTFALTTNKSSLKTHERLRWERSGIMLYFIPRRPIDAKIWRLLGTLDPFVEKKVPFETQIKSIAAVPPSLLMPRTQKGLKVHKPMDLRQRFRKKSGIILTEKDEGAFLYDPETGNLKYLNPTARETYSTLGDQRDVEQLIHHLSGLYPDADPKKIQRDVECFLNDLDQNGFICPI